MAMKPEKKFWGGGDRRYTLCKHCGFQLKKKQGILGDVWVHNAGGSGKCRNGRGTHATPK